MADEVLPSYAIWGSGEVDADNAAALLDDMLPKEDIGIFYRPTQVPRGTSLKAVIDRLESPKILGPKGTVPTEDPIESLLARRSVGDTTMLIMLWPEEPKDTEKELVIRAREVGIRVVTLNGAVDDLLWEPEPEPEPEVEEEPEAPAEEAATPSVPADILPVGTPSQVLNVLEAWVRAIIRDELSRATVVAPSNGKAAVAPAKTTVAPQAAVDRVAAHLSGQATEAEEIPDDVPPFNGPYQTSGPKFQAAPGGSATEERTAYYKTESEDGDDDKATYRKAKTRPRRGEKRVMLSDAEIDRFVREGRVTDN